jgi:hypothetical protein
LGLFDEFRQRGASFVNELSFIDDGLWGFELAMPTGMCSPSFGSATIKGIPRTIAGASVCQSDDSPGAKKRRRPRE